MNRRQRLMASVRGDPVDRPPVSFYELNGLDEIPTDQDPFNIYSDPSWQHLINLTREKSDCIVMRSVPFTRSAPDPIEELTTTETWLASHGSLFTRKTVNTGERKLTSVTRRDRDVNTIWTVEHLLKDVEDLRAFLEIPTPSELGEPELACVLEAEYAIGEAGIVMIDTPDPLCEAAQLFEMGTYTILALTETNLFHKLLERFAEQRYKKTEAIAKNLPGHLWRIYGPEYASPPYLPPRLFKEYVVRYDTPMVREIQQNGGYARLHSHGNLHKILDLIVETGCSGLDPIEPPPQGDVELSYVRENYGRQLTLFGNLEASDIENLPTNEFRQKVLRALNEGTRGEGRGFVLMPSACPYGRKLSPLAMANYQCMIDVIEEWG